MKSNNKLKHVIAGYKSKYEIKEITIICDYKPLYSGSFDGFYSNCDIKMIVYRNQLLEREVIEKSLLNNTKLFIFLQDEGQICPVCNRKIIGEPCLSRKDNNTPICDVCGSREALENCVNAGQMTEEDMNNILNAIKIHYRY